MTSAESKIRFRAKLLRPAAKKNASWRFLVLPREASEKLPRRGRTSVAGTLNDQPFRSTLEPDGQLSHWLKVEGALCEAAGVNAGDSVTLEICSVAQEPEPEVPRDFHTALDAAPQAKAVWEDTTTLARLDWIHWIDSAKQVKTRARRIENACEMLDKGKRRVCCFDSSGYYDHSLSAPEAED